MNEVSTVKDEREVVPTVSKYPSESLGIEIYWPDTHEQSEGSVWIFTYLLTEGTVGTERKCKVYLKWYVEPKHEVE